MGAGSDPRRLARRAGRQARLEQALRAVVIGVGLLVSAWLFWSR